MAACARAASLARAPTSPSSFASSTASPASLNSLFDRLPDELIEGIGVYVYDDDAWPRWGNRSDVQAFSAACRRFWTILEPLRWKSIEIDTSTADFARLNVRLAETGRHVARLHLTLDARCAYQLAELTACLRLNTSLVHVKLRIVLPGRGQQLPPQHLTEIYQALQGCSTRLQTFYLRERYQSDGFYVAGLTELLRQSTSLRALHVLTRLHSIFLSPTAPNVADVDHFCAALAGLTQIRVAHLEMDVLSGLSKHRPLWPHLAYASLQIDYPSAVIDLNTVLHHCRRSLRAIALKTFAANLRVIEASGPLHFPRLETVMVCTTQAFNLFCQLIYSTTPVNTLFLPSLTPPCLQRVEAFYDDQPMKTLARLVIPPQQSWENAEDPSAEIALREFRDWAGPRGIAVLEADEDSFCDELQRRAWQGW